jgi:hypothetical protein
MTTDISELLRASAPIPTRDINFEAMDARLRRRRLHRVVARALAVGIVLATATVTVFIARDTTEGPSIATQTPPEAGGTVTGQSEQGPVSISPPEGWHALSPGATAGPAEILTVATVRGRPTPGVITACTEEAPSGRAAYISIYEYGPGSPLIMPTNDGTFSESAFQPRPQEFDPVQAPGADCADPSTGTTSNHFRMLLVTEHGRRFLIRVVTTDDPSRELLAAAGPVLDTARVGG